VAAPKRLARELLSELQKVGVVHIDPLRPEELVEYRLSPAEEAELRRWEGIVTQSEQSLGVVGAQAAASQEPFAGSLGEAEATVKPLSNRAEVLGKERAALEEELQAIELFGKAADKLAGLAHGLDSSPRVAIIPFLVSKPEELEPVRAALQQALGDRFALDSDNLDNQVAAVLVVKKNEVELARSTLSRLGLAELRFPGAFASLTLTQAAARMKERAKLAPEELVGIRQEVQKLERDGKDYLESLWTRAKDEAARYKATADMAAGKYGVALMGWVPQKARAKAEEALNRMRGQVAYEFLAVDEHHEADQVPVTLENPAWAKPFELLHGFLNTPRYGAYDPTVMIASFYPVFFGLVVGDIGIGVLFGLVAWWLGSLARQKKNLVIGFLGANLGPDVVGSLSRVLWWMTFWTVVFGFVYGEFFGTFLEKLHFFYDPNAAEGKGLIPILVNRLDFAKTSTFLMLVSIALGVIQVLYAFIIRMQQGLKHGHRSHFWEGFGYLSGAVGLIAFAYNFLTKAGNPVLTAILVIGLLLFVASAVLAKMPLMVAELPSKGGQILSYIRIYAVGVASALLNSLANTVGFALAAKLGFIGGILGFVIGTIVLLAAIAVTTLGHLLQPIRLLWIEFGTNFGFYDESGRPYRPFKSVRGNQQ